MESFYGFICEQALLLRSETRSLDTCGDQDGARRAAASRATATAEQTLRRQEQVHQALASSISRVQYFGSKGGCHSGSHYGCFPR